MHVIQLKKERKISMWMLGR